MALVLWLAFAAVNLGWPERASGGTYAATAAMAALSAAGILSALARRPLLMLGVFLVSFFPIGLYMLGVPSVFRGIGLANVVFLAASLCAFAGRYRAI